MKEKTNNCWVPQSDSIPSRYYLPFMAIVAYNIVIGKCNSDNGTLTLTKINLKSFRGTGFLIIIYGKHSILTPQGADNII